MVSYSNQATRRLQATMHSDTLVLCCLDDEWSIAVIILLSQISLEPSPPTQLTGHQRLLYQHFHCFVGY